MKISLVLTNDWELYGEGSGDFYQIQKNRLKSMLECVERHGAKMSIFAEVGQQWAHLKEGQESKWALNIAREWETCLQDAITRGHDVQMHFHPTWYESFHNGTEWKLNLNNWALADLSFEQIEHELKRGREYFNFLFQKVVPNYKCLCFRAGAFCLQPIDRTLLAIKSAGFVADSSVLPGYWDYLYFDYRDVLLKTGPYVLSEKSLNANRQGSAHILELPVHTEQVWDVPILRRLLPAWLSLRWQFGISPDFQYIKWARERDKNIKELSPMPDPLAKKRFLAKLSPFNWLSYFFRKSTFVLDYDFMQPQLFVELVRRAGLRARKKGLSEVVLICLGHANNSHTSENLDAILRIMDKTFGDNLNYMSVQEAIEKYI